jgi:hypothetical protein
MNKKATTAKRNTTKAKTTAAPRKPTGAKLDALPAKQEGPAVNATPYHSKKVIPLKSIADRWEEAAQSEPNKDKFTLSGVWVKVDLYDTTKDSTEFLPLHGDAKISFSDNEDGGFIAHVILEDRRRGKALVFEDWHIRYKCLQNKDRSIFGAFVMPRIVTITDGKFHARAQYFFPPKDGEKATADCWENGSVDNCKIMDVATVGTPPGDPKQLEIKTPEGELKVRKYGNLEIKREASKGNPAIIVDNSQKGIDTIKNRFIQYSIPNGPAWENLRTLFFNHAFSEDKALPIKNPWRGLNGDYRKFIEAYARMTSGTPHKWWIETK